jgi:hypothetical protein
VTPGRLAARYKLRPDAVASQLARLEMRAWSKATRGAGPLADLTVQQMADARKLSGASRTGSPHGTQVRCSKRSTLTARDFARAIPLA